MEEEGRRSGALQKALRTVIDRFDLDLKKPEK
jgi:hypothetical protein